MSAHRIRLTVQRVENTLCNLTHAVSIDEHMVEPEGQHRSRIGDGDHRRLIQAAFRETPKRLRLRLAAKPLRLRFFLFRMECAIHPFVRFAHQHTFTRLVQFHDAHIRFPLQFHDFACYLPLFYCQDIDKPGYLKHIHYRIVNMTNQHLPLLIHNLLCR